MPRTRSVQVRTGDRRFLWDGSRKINGTSYLSNKCDHGTLAWKVFYRADGRFEKTTVEWKKMMPDEDGKKEERSKKE